MLDLTPTGGDDGDGHNSQYEQADQNGIHWTGLVSENGIFDKRYKLLELIEEGENSLLFKAVDRHFPAPDYPDEDFYAIKVMHPKHSGEGTDDTSARKSFQREVNVLATFRRYKHESIVEIIAYDLEARLPFIVTKFIDGDSLRRKLYPAGERNDVLLPLEEAMYIEDHVLAALEHAHKHGKKHNDLQPGNVIRGRECCKVLDFGKRTSQGRLRGLLGAESATAYTPPEVRDGKGFDEHGRSDIYCAGMLLDDMLSGIRGRAKTLETVVADSYPCRELKRLINKATAYDPAGRYQSASDFCKALNSWKELESEFRSITSADITSAGKAYDLAMEITNFSNSDNFERKSGLLEKSIKLSASLVLSKARPIVLDKAKKEVLALYFRELEKYLHQPINFGEGLEQGLELGRRHLHQPINFGEGLEQGLELGRRLVQILPDNAEAHYLLSKLLFNNADNMVGDYLGYIGATHYIYEMITEGEQALSLSPDNVEYLTHLGDILSHFSLVVDSDKFQHLQKENGNDIGGFPEEYKLVPEPKPDLKELIKAAAEYGTNAKWHAIELYEKAAKLSPDSAIIHKRLAKVYYDTNELIWAMYAMERVIDIIERNKKSVPEKIVGMLEPSDLPAFMHRRAYENHFLMGMIYDKIREQKKVCRYSEEVLVNKGIIAYLRATSLDPTNKGIHQLLAKVFQAKADIEEKKASGKLIPEQNQDTQESTKTICAVLDQISNSIEMRESDSGADKSGQDKTINNTPHEETNNKTLQEKPVAIVSDPAQEHSRLAMKYYNQGDYNNAILHFKKLIELQCDDWSVYQYYGCALTWINRYDLAVEQFEQAINKDPLNRKSMDALADCYYSLGQFNHAITWYKSALQPPDPDLEKRVYPYLGRSYMEIGDLANARYYSEKAVKIGCSDANKDLEYILAEEKKEDIRLGGAVVGICASVGLLTGVISYLTFPSADPGSAGVLVMSGTGIGVSIGAYLENLRIFGKKKK